MLYGVDVHGGYQAGLDFPTLRRQGYSFAVTKASQGTGYVGPRFVEWIAATRAAGMIPGAYHWIERGNAAAQCDHFLNVLSRVGGPNGLLCQLDCEDTATWADLQEWDRLWTQRTGGQPYLLYTGRWWWTAPGRGWDGSTLTPLLWDSHYLTADTDGLPDDPAAFAARIPAAWWKPGYGGWSAATILQFTSKGDAGKLANNVDLNATHLTREQLLALTQPPEDIMAYPTPQEIAAAVLAAPVKGTGTSDHPADRTVGQVLADGYQRQISHQAELLAAIEADPSTPPAGGTAPTAEENAAAVVAELRAHPLAPTA